MMRSDLTTGNILTHISKIAVPSSVGFLFHTLFNVVGTYFAGMLGPEALAGLSMSFPIFFILLALSSGIGSGATALLAIALGKKNPQEFNLLGMNALVLGGILTLLLTLTANYITPLLFSFMGAKGLALTYGVAYTDILFYGSFFFIMNFILNGLLNSQGDTRSFRNALVAGFFLNLILNPLFTLGWFGLPKMGTAGIALATVIVEALITLYLGKRFVKSALFDPAQFKKSKPSLHILSNILKQGIPAGLNMMSIAVGIFIINYYVQIFGGDNAVAAYGAALRIEQLVLLPTIGLNIAALAIAGQNFGAGNFERIDEVFKKSVWIAMGILTAGIVCIYPLAEFLIRIFNQDPGIVEVGADYIRISVFALYTYALIAISSSILQAIKKPAFSFYIGLYRQVLLPVILFYFLGTYLNLGLNGIWWGIVLINWSAVVITFFYTRKRLRIARVVATSLKNH